MIQEQLQHMTKAILEYQAWLWNGRQQISGRLILLEHKLSFEITSFQKSNLQLEIFYRDIIQIREFLLFDLARYGLRINTINGRSDLFVLDDPASLKRALQDRLINK